jgi:hypothetical protein
VGASFARDRIASRARNHLETPRLLAAQRDSGAEHAKLERIAAERGAHKRELGPFDEPEHHEALNCGVSGRDRFNPDCIAGFEVRQGHRAYPSFGRKCK